MNGPMSLQHYSESHSQLHRSISKGQRHNRTHKWKSWNAKWCLWVWRLQCAKSVGNYCLITKTIWWSFHILSFSEYFWGQIFLIFSTPNFWQASTDQSVLDLEMANKLGWCAFSVIQLLGTIAVMSQVAWEVFVIFIPVTAICIWYQVSRSIKFVGEVKLSIYTMDFISN